MFENSGGARRIRCAQCGSSTGECKHQRHGALLLQLDEARREVKALRLAHRVREAHDDRPALLASAKHWKARHAELEREVRSLQLAQSAREAWDDRVKLRASVKHWKARHAEAADVLRNIVQSHRLASSAIDAALKGDDHAENNA